MIEMRIEMSEALVIYVSKLCVKLVSECVVTPRKKQDDCSYPPKRLNIAELPERVYIGNPYD
jgi:hypothetical protein